MPNRLRHFTTAMVAVAFLLPTPAYPQVWGGIGEGLMRGAEFMQRKREMELEQERLRLIQEQNRLQRELLEQEQNHRDAERIRAENAIKKEEERQQRERESGTSGSGFFVSRAGHVLTNAHVVQKNPYVIARDHSGETFPLEVLAIDHDLDLALLKANRKTEGVGFAASDRIEKGLRVFAIGFPQPTIQGIESKITDGVISSLSGVQGDENLLQISVPIQGGNSGGPLVSEDGSLVGVVVATLSARTFFSQTGNLPQNINFAIKSDIAKHFLIKNKINPLEPKRNKSNPLGFVDRNTVLIIANPKPIGNYFFGDQNISKGPPQKPQEKLAPPERNESQGLTAYEDRVKVLYDRASRGEVLIERVHAKWSRLHQPTVVEFVKMKDSIWLPESVSNRLEHDHLFAIEGTGEKAGLVIHLVNNTEADISFLTYHLTDSSCKESERSAYLAIKLSTPLVSLSERIILIPDLQKNAPQISIRPLMCGIVNTAWSLSRNINQ